MQPLGLEEIVMSESLEISPAEVKAKLDQGDEFLFLDIREEDEYALANIVGVKLLPMSQLAERVAEIQAWKDQPIVVHCHKGGRSLRVTHWLKNEGFQNVRSLAGGIEAWSAEIDPEVPQY